jgi:branched-chain amino acid transport system substrate-binding protein
VHQRSVLRVGASLVAASLALSACGSRGDSGTGASDGKKIAKIGVMAPLSGDLSLSALASSTPSSSL